MPNRILKNLQTARFISFIAFAGLIIAFGVYVKNNNNTFLYPDSFIYLKWNIFDLSSKVSLNDFTQELDYLTLLKPLAAVYLQLVAFTNISPKIINTFWIVSSFVLIARINWKKFNNSSIFLLPFVFCIFLFNGNNYYWIGRYTTEFFSMFLFSLALFLALKKQNPFALFFVQLVLILIRPEFILIAPILILIDRKLVSYQALIEILFTVYAGLIALRIGDFDVFLTNILLPLVAINAFVLVAQFKPRLFGLNCKKTLQVISLSLLTLVASFVISHLTLDYNIPKYFTGIASAALLMFSFYALTLTTLIVKDIDDEDIVLSLCFIILSGTYIVKSYDVFRYWLLISPIFMHFILSGLGQVKEAFAKLIGSNRYSSIIFIPFGLLIILQLVLNQNYIANDSIKENYWVDRFELIEDYKASTIVSSTPIISSYLGYRSAYICGEIPENEDVVFLVDEYSKTLCPEKISKIITSYKLSHKGIHLGQVTNYSSKSFVEIERYRSNGQKTLLLVNRN